MNAAFVKLQSDYVPPMCAVLAGLSTMLKVSVRTGTQGWAWERTSHPNEFVFSRHKQIGAAIASRNRSRAGRVLHQMNLAELRVHNCGQGDENNRHQEPSDLCSHARNRQA